MNLSAAKYFAERSGIRSFSTGAVIVNPNLGNHSSSTRAISSGWSHYSELKLANYRSIHAEVHAILRSSRIALRGATIYIATIRNKSRNIGMAYPCKYCLALLNEVGITDVYYTIEKDEYGHERLT